MTMKCSIEKKEATVLWFNNIELEYIDMSQLLLILIWLGQMTMAASYRLFLQFGDVLKKAKI